MNVETHFTQRFSDEISAYLSETAATRLCFLIDENVWRLHGNGLLKKLPENALKVLIPAGEKFKTLETCQKVWDAFYENRIDRKAFALIIGGGMAADLGAFACAAWMRGLRYALVPTTLLAMIDATIGGKTGVDYRDGKNLIGFFNPPEAVFVEPLFLATLPERELRSGFAEALKHALIADADYWRLLANLTQSASFPTLSPEETNAVVRRSIEIKQNVVKQDPREKGLRKTLNFGHTLGHALESACLKTENPLLHGEAVALGMLAESFLSIQYAGLAEERFQQIKNAIEQAGFPMKAPEVSAEKVRHFLALDKKNEQGGLRFSLITEIGHSVYDVEIPIRQALTALEQTKIL